MATSKRPAEAKNLSEYMAIRNGTPLPSEVIKDTKDVVGNKLRGAELAKHLEAQLSASGDTVWVQNVAGSEFHILPLSAKGDDQHSAIRFALNEIQSFTPEQVKTSDFKKAFLAGKLQVVKESDIVMIQRKLDQLATAEKNSSYSSDDGAGLHESGLPLNKKTARRYIDDCEDLDLLEGWLQKEDRDKICDYIEERIEDIESGNAD